MTFSGVPKIYESYYYHKMYLEVLEAGSYIPLEKLILIMKKVIQSKDLEGQWSGFAEGFLISSEFMN